MGPVEKEYFYEIDDPYKILAHHIVGFYRPADVLRVLTDNTYLKNLVMKDTRMMDLGGPFIDCIIEGILEDKNRMEYMRELDRLGSYYYSRLDKERLRDEILAVLNEAGISLGI